MRPFRLHWDAVEGWLLDVPVAQPPHIIQRVIDWSVPKQVDRLRALPPGEKKEELTKAIQLLQAGQLKQRLVGFCGDGKGDLVMFEAQRPHDDRKIISVGAG